MNVPPPFKSKIVDGWEPARKLTPEHIDDYREYLRSLAKQQMSRRLQVKVDISDVVQQTLLSAIVALPKFRGCTEPEFRAWLKRILVNKIAYIGRHWRSKKRSIAKEVNVDLPSHGTGSRSQRGLREAKTPSAVLIHREQVVALNEALHGLLEDERSAIVLKYLHGWSVLEIAAHLGRTRHAVAGLLHRGLKKLRNELDEKNE